MALISLRQMLDHAAEHGYGVPAFNVNNLEQTRAIMEAADAVESTLMQLPPDYATVIRMYDLQGRPIAEVAAEMNRSTGAVHMLRARAHDQLRCLLGTETDFFSHPA